MNAPNPTLAAIVALLPTLPDSAMRRRVESALIAPSPKEMPVALPDCVLSANETATAFSVTPKTVHRMAAEGVLHRVRLPGRKRGVGFLRSEVVELLARCARGV